MSAINKGYLKSNTTEKGDEVLTPYYAVDPLIKYIEEKFGKNYLPNILCPFDKFNSAFVKTFQNKGYNVTYSHFEEKDFFSYTKQEIIDLGIDIIISNPPFSKKNNILKHLEYLGVPYCVLLPLNALQSKERFEIMKNIEVLSFDSRIDYHTWGNLEKYKKGVAFSSAYFCKNLLPERLIVEKLIKYNKPLISNNIEADGTQSLF